MLKLNNHSWKKNTKLIFCGKSEAKISLFEKKRKQTRLTKNQENSAHNYPTNHLVKFRQDRIKP